MTELIRYKLFLNYFSGVICATCRYWKKKNEKHKEMFGVVFTSNIGICNNVAAMEQILLIPNNNAINIIPNATIETDEGYNFIGAAASNQEFRDVEYHHPDFDELDEYKDDEDNWTDEYYEEMDSRRQMVLDEVLSFIQQDLSE